MGIADKFPKNGWAKVQVSEPVNAGALDWDDVAGKTFQIIDVDVEKELVLLRTYMEVGQNYWFYAEYLIPGKESPQAYINRKLEEDNHIANFQKKLRDDMMRKVFGK